MLIDVAYRFDAEIVRPRKRNGTRVVYVGSTIVDVAEVPSGEAPVALRVPDRWSEETQFEEFRWQAGRLLKRYGETPTPLSWLAEVCAEPTQYARHPLHAGTGRWVDAGETRMADDREIGRVLASSEEETVRKIRELAARVVAVDGILWAEAPEPVYVIERGSHWRQFFVDIPGKVPPYHVFRLDQRELAEELYRDVVDFEGCPRAEVLIPESLRYPADEKALDEAADRMTKMMADHLKQAGKDYFSAYADLRDAAGAAGQPDDRDAVAAALRAAVLAHKGSGESFWSEQDVEAALRRWDERSLSLPACFAP